MSNSTTHLKTSPPESGLSAQGGQKSAQGQVQPAQSEHGPSAEAVWARLRTVLDPELQVNIVALGLVYDVTLEKVETSGQVWPHIHVLLTLTSPGCPLAGTFDRMVRDAMFGLPGVNPERDVTVELTFDPPWIVDMIDPEVKAQLGI